VNPAKSQPINELILSSDKETQAVRSSIQRASNLLFEASNEEEENQKQDRLEAELMGNKILSRDEYSNFLKNNPAKHRLLLKLFERQSRPLLDLLQGTITPQDSITSDKRKGDGKFSLMYLLGAFTSQKAFQGTLYRFSSLPILPLSQDIVVWQSFAVCFTNPEIPALFASESKVLYEIEVSEPFGIWNTFSAIADEEVILPPLICFRVVSAGRTKVKLKCLGIYSEDIKPDTKLRDSAEGYIASCQSGNAYYLRLIRQRPAQVQAGIDPVHFAALSGNRECLRLALSLEKDPRGKVKITPELVKSVIQAKKPEMVNYLLKFDLSEECNRLCLSYLEQPEKPSSLTTPAPKRPITDQNSAQRSTNPAAKTIEPKSTQPELKKTAGQPSSLESAPEYQLVTSPTPQLPETEKHKWVKYQIRESAKIFKDIVLKLKPVDEAEENILKSLSQGDKLMLSHLLLSPYWTSAVLEATQGRPLHFRQLVTALYAVSFLLLFIRLFFLSFFLSFFSYPRKTTLTLGQILG